MPDLESSSRSRLATAVGFLSGVIACLDALRESRIVWPPDTVWQALRHPQRLELAGGIALIVVSLVTSIVQARKMRSHH